MSELLTQLGFIHVQYDGLGTDIYQRKTLNTNIIVKLDDNKALVMHGSPTQNIYYGTVDNTLDLEVLITSVSTSQLNSRNQ